MEPVIRATAISKKFKLPKEKHGSLKSAILNFRGRSYQEFSALRDINLEVKPGEFFGIIGRNGSGKSTLLKILAGIYQPSSGQVEINGRLTPFIELGVGFNMELTGRDNVFLNGAILGLTRKEIEARYDEIVAFAELAEFMDQKLKNYSSGMQVRLAFSVAIQAHSDILLIDEVLAVGDLNFQGKGYDHFHKLKQQRKTVVLVTHDMSAIEEFCNRGAVLNNGKIVSIGEPREIVSKYLDLNQKLEAKTESRSSLGGSKLESEVRIESFLADKKILTPKDRLVVKIVYRAIQDLKNPVVGLAMTAADGRVVFASDTKAKKLSLGEVSKGKKGTVIFKIDNVYTDGTYTLSCAVNSQDNRTSYARYDSGLTIRVRGQSFTHSLVHPAHSISLGDED